MDADYQRFTRLQTFLLICSLFVGRLAVGDLPLFACVFLRSLYTLYIADYYISSLLVVAAGFVSLSFLWVSGGRTGMPCGCLMAGLRRSAVLGAVTGCVCREAGTGSGSVCAGRAVSGGCRAVGTSCASSGTGSGQASLLHNAGHGEVEKRKEENYPGDTGGTKERQRGYGVLLFS